MMNFTYDELLNCNDSETISHWLMDCYNEEFTINDVQSCQIGDTVQFWSGGSCNGVNSFTGKLLERTENSFLLDAYDSFESYEPNHYWSFNSNSAGAPNFRSENMAYLFTLLEIGMSIIDHDEGTMKDILESENEDNIAMLKAFLC